MILTTSRVTASQIPFKEMLPNGLLLYRCSYEETQSAELLERNISLMRTELDKTILVLPIRANSDLVYVPEELMNGAGWFRDISKAVPKMGFEEVKDRREQVDPTNGKNN